jgi:hypothetical protein
VEEVDRVGAKEQQQPMHLIVYYYPPPTYSAACNCPRPSKLSHSTTHSR